MKLPTHTGMLRAAIVGYGQMGRTIERLAEQRSIEIARRFDIDAPLTESVHADFDVAIEFTHPEAVLNNIRTLARLGKPVVVGTTGWLGRLDDVRSEINAHNGRLIYASNFSIGVNIFFALVRQAAHNINAQPMYDAAVHEIHHTAKADSPSGTALSIAQIMIDEIDRKTQILSETSHGRIAPEALHVSSQRLGSTFGTHTVTFDSTVDTIELTHRARSRDGFALGALAAARWIVEQPPGFYRFEDLFS